MVAVSKVVHGFELLVNNPDASFVGPVRHTLDIFSSLTHLPQLEIDALSSLNGSLGVELS